MRQILFLIVITLTFQACSIDKSNLPTFQIGDDFTNSNVRIIEIDTFKTILSTYKFDSINSSTTNRLLFGKYQDVSFGDVRASSYAEFTGDFYNIDDDAVLDSVAVILGYDKYFYNDTTAMSTINIHTINEEVKPAENVFYNINTLLYDSNLLASKTFYPRPHGKDSLHVTLPFEFGETLFNKITDGEINSDNDLRLEFKGLTFQPNETDNSAIIGFSKSNSETYIRFFYSIPGEFNDETDEKTYDLYIKSNIERSFNNIISNPAGTPLDVLIDQEINLYSNDSDNKSYIQSGVGYATRVEFPTLKNLNDIPGTGTLLSATLQVKSTFNIYEDILPAQDSIVVSIADQNNEASFQLSIGENRLYGIKNTENIEFSEDFYEIPVSPYIEQKLNETRIVDDALLLFTRDYNAVVDRIILEDSDSDEFKAKLILTYAIYDE